MPSEGEHDEFVLQMISAQNRLYAYILSLVFDSERAADVLQQTNLVLLQKRSEFHEGSDFIKWAYRVAFYEVLADRRSRARDKHLFSDELLAVIASHTATVNESLNERASALESCLEKLSTTSRQLVIDRYRPGESVASLAEKLKKSPAAVSAQLYRIRTALVDCVERRLGSTTP